MDVLIRPERPDEYNTVNQLVQTAFETAECYDGNEKDFTVALRNSTMYLPELSLVAENKDGDIVGYIMFTRNYIQQENGKYEIAMIGPLAVLFEYRKRKIGSLLISEGLKRAKEMGFNAAVLCGDPAYYHRFGFKPASGYKLDLSAMDAEYHPAVQVYELKEDALKNIEGDLTYLLNLNINFNGNV